MYQRKHVSGCRKASTEQLKNREIELKDDGDDEDYN